MYELRILNKEEISKFIELRILEQKEYNKTIISEKFIENTKDFVIEKFDKDLILFGFLYNNQLISTCAIQIVDFLPFSSENSKTAFLFNVYTLKDYRKLGYANKLLKYVINYCEKNKVGRIKLNTNCPIAKKMYENLGFHISNTTLSLKL